MRALRLVFVIVAAVLVLARPDGVAAEDAGAEGGAPAAADDAGSGAPEWDPIEPVNRPIFRFNDTLDEWVLEPVARGWDTIAPDPVEDSIQNFFLNLRFPIVFVNGVLQAKPRSAAISLSRFMANTVFGVVGLFDVATGWGLERQEEDFGQTLGYWGVPPGPYLVSPLLGPSNVRDTVGFIADGYTQVATLFINGFIWMGGGVVNTINTRAQYLDQVERAKEASLDYYGFARNAYMQRRAALVRDEALPENEADDLYDTDFIPEEGR